MLPGQSEMNGPIVDSEAESDLRRIGVLRSFRSPLTGCVRHESDFRAIRDLLRRGFVAESHSKLRCERNHQGLRNQLISPEAGHLGSAGEIQRRQRLGGMLNYYYRAAA